MKAYYKADLAFIHDVGFGDYARGAAPGILNVLARCRIRDGLVVDLGCGSGVWAQLLTEAGYGVLGIDISEAMIEIARRRAPRAEFRVGSLFEMEIPPCNAITSLGECFNYLFDPDNARQSLGQFFRRIYRALAPGGVLIFDIVEPGQIKPGIKTKTFTEGQDWVVLVEKEENLKPMRLTRRIITFRKVGEHYRRDDEQHRQRLFKATDVASQLRRAGFRVRTSRRYGQFRLPPARMALVARKPG
jgi:SAM-dependent methyltransferase